VRRKSNLAKVLRLEPKKGAVPPNNVDAEAAVLSQVLLHPETLDEVVDLLKPDHFYSFSNSKVFEAMMELAGTGAAIDVVSVAAWLQARELYHRVGGMEYMLLLRDSIPSYGKSITTHAKIVHDLWRIRELAIACHRGAAGCYGDVGDVQAYVDDVEQSIYDIAHVSATNDAQPIGAVLQDAFREIVAVAESGGRISGLPTGYYDLDEMLAGLHGGDVTVVAGRPGMGKAQPLEAKVLTPIGWRLMGSLQVGDLVIGADGASHRITGVFDRGELDVYRVTTSDGASTECCDEHLWLTRNRSERRRGVPGGVRKLREIRATLERAASGGLNHSIQFMRPAEFEPVGDLPIDPYLMGIYLGDGCGSGRRVGIDNPEADIRERVRELLPKGDALTEAPDGLHMRIRREKRTGVQSNTRASLEAMGLTGRRSWEKFIPEVYLRAPVADRVALLQGLCDTDGYVVQPKIVEYTTTSPALLAGLEFLVGSLGGRFTWTEKDAHYTKADGARVPTRKAYRALISFPGGHVTPVSSQKHLARWAGGRVRISERFIQRVEYVGKKACRCIAVDAADHLYVTDGFLVTHNTSKVLNIAVNVASPREERREHGEMATVPGEAAVVFSLEMPRDQLGKRMLCTEARVDLGKLRRGRLQPADWNKLTEAAARLGPLPVIIEDTPGLGLMEIRARVRRHQATCARNGIKLGLVVIDYLQLMQGREDARSREEEIGEISRGLKRLAKELKVPVIVLSQLNREVEKRSAKTKRPQLSDLRESGAIEQDADNIIFITRRDYYEQEDTPNDWKGIAEIDVAKQRNGATGRIYMRFDASCTRFDNLAREDWPQTSWD
jgi:replicative DNA helicase